jgi:hypothetical protein
MFTLVVAVIGIRIVASFGRTGWGDDSVVVPWEDPRRISHPSRLKLLTGVAVLTPWTSVAKAKTLLSM